MTSTGDRPTPGTASKILIALATFTLIFGGWWVLQSQRAERAAMAPLPDETRDQGRCDLWFIGSSSVYRWRTLHQDMAPWAAHNRGIEGATFAQITPRFEPEEGKRRPQAIVLYAGENDIATGRTAEQAIEDLHQFVARKTALFGDMPLLIVSMKPSPTRWKNFAAQARFNGVARALAARRRDISFVDIVPLLLVSGRPGAFYVADGIHMNEAGYRVWAGAIRAALIQALPGPVVRACDPAASRPAGRAGAGAARSI